MVLASAPKPNQPQHVKKRHGQHHKQSKHYRKTYWPYLPMLLVIALGVFVNSVWSGHGKVLDYATAVSGTTLLQETNIQRSAGGIGALALNNSLSRAAQDKADDMAARDYWAHVTPEGKQPWQFISATGYAYTLAGENLAYGFATSSDAVAGWMNSATHRANIMKADYQEVGFGIADAPSYQGNGEQTIIVAMYAKPAKVAAAAPAPAATVKSTPTPPAATPPAATPTEETPPPSSPAPPAQTPDPTAQKTPTEEAAAQASNTQNLTAQPVSRIDVLTDGNAEWATLVISVLVVVGGIALVYRHGKMWRRYVLKGEHFLIKHPLYDIAIVAAVVVCVILSRTSGFIH